MVGEEYGGMGETGKRMGTMEGKQEGNRGAEGKSEDEMEGNRSVREVKGKRMSGWERRDREKDGEDGGG